MLKDTIPHWLLRTCLSAVFLALLPGIARAQWKEVKAEHFIVLYPQSGSSDMERFARDVGSSAERYYKRIANELGYPRYSDFWTWDRRVKIYLYPDHAQYIKSGNYPAWSAGMADYTAKTIYSFYGSERFLEHTLPHEIAHLIFRDFVGFKGEIPFWLDEGVAQWAEEALRPSVRQLSRQMYEKDSLLTFSDMMSIDVRKIANTGNVYIRPTITKQNKPGVLFLTGDALVNNYYILAASLVGFLIERYGSTEFAKLCRELRDGKTMAEAVKAVYYTHIRDLDELEQEWRRHINKEEE